jgi:hypothetical protein
MSYQRWTEGDAYVIGSAGEGGVPMFWCVGCETPRHRTYRDIIAHLESVHRNSDVALERLRKEAAIVGVDASWDAYLAHESLTKV